MNRADFRMTWILRLLAPAALALALPASAGHLQHLTLGAGGGITTLKLSADAPVQFSDFSLKDPDRIVIDCINTDGALKAPTFSDDLVREVNFVSIAGDHGPTTRMIVSLRRPSEYTIAQKQTALEVSIQPANVKTASSGLIDVSSAAHMGHVTLDIQGADVKTVLRTLAESSGRNIVPTKDVHGEVSMSLHNVGWREALDVLCRAQSLAYKEENGIIRVGPLEQIQNEELAKNTAERKAEELLPLETRTVHVTFAHVDELKTTLTGMLSTRGHIDADERTSSLVITDIAQRAEAAEALALKLDSRTPQITITAKLIDVDASVSTDLGIKWNTANTSGTLNTGLKVDNAIGGAAGTVTVGTVSPDNNVFNLALQALERENKANIISNPTITTVDNREARILVGQKIPLIVADAAGNAVTQLTTIGIQLRVTPHLNTDNKITMDVHPEVSDLSAQSTVQGGVIINTSEADTRVLVEDGQTAVIGGLIRTNESKFVQGIPILKDIPLIGGLFRSTNTTKQKRDLMILITPHLVTGTPGQ